MRGRLALHGGIGGDDQLLHLALGETLAQQAHAQLVGTEPVQRRQPPEQHEVQAAVAGGLLDRGEIGRRLHHAQHVAVARRAGAQRAHRLLAEGAALPAVADALHRRGQRRGEAAAAVAVAFQQMEGHALRALRADARQAA